MQSERSPQQHTSTEQPDRSHTLAGDLQRLRHNRNLRFGGVAASIVLGATVAIAAASAIESDPQNADPETYSDSFDPSIAELTLHEGARVRHDPRVGDPQQESPLVVDETVTIPVPDGAYRVGDQYNGDWFGVSAKAVEAVTGESFGKQDKDGIVWVSSQRADPTLVELTEVDTTE